MTSQPLILTIDDEQAMRRTLCLVLRGQGYATLEAATAEDGLYQASLRAPNLVLLDLGLPDRDGIEVTRILRRTQQVPIIVVSAREAEAQQVEALDAGANDFVVKPFREAELMARVRAALRYAPQLGKPVEHFVSGRLHIDFIEHEVLLDDQSVKLTSKEFKLLAVLVRQAGRVITYRTLLREVWGPARESETHYLRVFMKQLRDKLERDPTRPEMLLTQQRVGYRFKPGA